MLLIFIGLKVFRLHHSSAIVICVCLLRAGFSLMFVALLGMLHPGIFGAELPQLDYVCWQYYFQSSCSFWPYATMAKSVEEELSFCDTVDLLGHGNHEPATRADHGNSGTTNGRCLWDTDAAMSVLTLSFPVSIFMLSALSMSTSRASFLEPSTLMATHLAAGAALCASSLAMTACIRREDGSVHEPSKVASHTSG